MAEENSDTPKAKGFSGLSSMVSDITDTPLPPPPTVEQPPSLVQSNPAGLSNDDAVAEPVRPSNSPTGNEPIPPLIKWLIGISLVVGAIFAISLTGKKEEVPGPYGMSSSTQTPSSSPPQAAAPPEPLEMLYESTPPAGQGLVLNFVQLRYCVAEKIRLNALEVFGRQSVDRYNAKIKFFNDRCSNFKYRTGELESVTEDMEFRRDRLEEQARVNWFKDESQRITKQADPQPQEASPTPPIQAPDVSPRAEYQEAPSSLIPTYLPPAPIVRPPSPAQQPSTAPSNSSAMPANSQLDFTGKSWVCQAGFRRVGNQCDPVQVPQNAQLDFTGRDWTCSAGYRRNGNECSPVQIPQFAQLDITGYDWTCSAGYRRNGNECSPVQIPQNAQLDLTGHDWTCSAGYRRSGNECLSVQIPQNGQLDFTGHDWVCSSGHRRS